MKNTVILWAISMILAVGIVGVFHLDGGQAFFTGAFFSILGAALGSILDLLERDRD